MSTSRPKKGKSDAGTRIEFSGLTSTVASDKAGKTAEFLSSIGRIDRLVALLGQTGEAGTASVAHMREVAFKLSRAHAAIMGRFGKSAQESCTISYQPRGAARQGNFNDA